MAVEAKKLNSVSPNKLLVNVLHIVQDISLKQHKMTSDTLNPKPKKKKLLCLVVQAKKLNSVSPNQLLVKVLHIVQDVSLKQHKMTNDTLNLKPKTLN